MARHLSSKPHGKRKAVGGVAAVVALVAMLLAALVPSASAITQPPDIGSATWNATWSPTAAWPPAADPGAWPVPATNPNLIPRCGIDIGVIVDRSGSIFDAGQATAYREGLNSLIDAFADTPSNLGLWSFATDASDTDAITYPWHQMADLSVPANVDSLHDTVNAVPIQTGFATNWEEGLRAPLQASVNASPEPELWLVVTDGQPTVHADDGGSGATTNNDDMAGGIASANQLKAADGGTKVIAVGVGPGVTEAGLQLISGPTEFDPTSNFGTGNFVDADYITTSFADLASNLDDFALRLCESSVTVTKEAATLAAPTTYTAAPGWTFTATNNTAPPAVTPASGPTNGSGQIEFTWNSPASETVTITETQQANFQLTSRTCTLNGVPFAFTSTANGVQLSLTQGQHVSCTFRNQPLFIDLSVAKTDGKTTTEPGATNSYVITATNAADATATATNVILTETVPANTTYEATGSAAWSCADESVAGTVCTINVGSLAPGASANRTFNVEVINPVGAGVSNITNTVTVTGTGNERDNPDPERTATDIDTLDAAPILSVTKTDGVEGPSGPVVAPGGLISYAIDFSNTGNEGAAGVVLNETVPALTTFVAAGSPGWDCNGGAAGQGDGAVAGTACVFTVGGLAAGSGGSAPFQVRVVDLVPAGTVNVHNVVLIDDNVCVTSCDSDDEDTPVDAAPILSVTKTDGVEGPSGPVVAPGGLISYAIGFSNTGNEGAAGVVLNETVPALTTFVAAGSPGWDCNGGAAGQGDGAVAGTACVFTVGGLAAGAGGSAPFQVRVVDLVPAGTTNVHNVVLIDDNVCVTSCDSDDEDTPVDAAPELEVLKTDDDATASPGDEITYTIQYRNVGNETDTGVQLIETVPEHTTFVDDGPGGWECATVVGITTCAYAVGDLEVSDAFSEVEFTVLVDDPLPAGVDEVLNHVIITDDICVGACDEDDEDTPLDAAPDLTVVKDDGGVSAEPGDEVTYTIEYANVGDQDATGVVLTEEVPVGSTFVGPGGWTCEDTTCTFEVGDLAAGDSGSVDFTVQVDDPFPEGQTELDNVVMIDDDGENGEDPTPENNTDDDQTPVDVAEVSPSEDDPPAVVAGNVVLPVTGQEVNGLLALAGLLLILGGVAAAASPAVAKRRRGYAAQHKA